MTMMTNAGDKPPSQATAEASKSAPQPPTTPTALVIGTDAYRGSLEPTSMNDAFEVAKLMASIGYCGVTSSAEALGRIMTGRGLGLSAMQSLRGIYTVKGRPGIDAALMQALCLQSPLCEYFDVVADKCDATRATYVTKRVGRPEVEWEFTIEQAEKMGVVDRGKDDEAKGDNNWNKAREAMLRARCKSELARIVFPDLIFGMYSREEIEAGVEPASKKDPNEIVGEILNAEESAIEAARGKVAVVQAAPRDFAKEAEELKAKIVAAGASKQARAVVREAIQKWDGVEPWKQQVNDLYNSTRPTRSAAATTTTASEPQPLGEENLFAGKDQTKP